MFPFHYRPIWSRVGFDIVTLAVLVYCVTVPVEDEQDQTQSARMLALISLMFILTLITAGWKSRWTLSFPMVLILPLQYLRIYLLHVSQNELYALRIIHRSTWALIILSAILCVLFPPVQLPPTDGPYHVAVLDIHLPLSENNITKQAGGSEKTSFKDGQGQSFVIARIAYPIQEEAKVPSSTFPFLPWTFAEKYCNLFMQKGGAPAPIRALTFLLHYWRLIRISRVTCSTHLSPLPLQLKDKRPCIVFSHGLSGNAITYSYPVLNLASHGYCVVALDHTDGSALHVFGPNGLEIPFDESFQTWDRPETTETYVKARRDQTRYRVNELISMIEHLFDTSRPWDSNLSHLLDTIKHGKVIGIGHSFGGATVLGAAALRPDLFDSVVALDPAQDWMPDYARWAWLGRCDKYKGGTGGYSSDFIMPCDNPMVHDVPSLFLFSEEWSSLGWGGYPFIQSLHQKGLLGPQFSSSRSSPLSGVEIVTGSSHMAFSDICLLIPTWIARSLGLTGKRNPHHVSEEICQRVLDFIDSIILIQ